jgi:hypothetical protein
MLEALGVWLKATQISWFVVNYPWVWPACETLHFIGLVMLIGTVCTLDFRMLGVAKGLPLQPLHSLMRWGAVGFVINLTTGFLFFVGTPYQYIGNMGFYFKMLFIVLAGINVLVFYLGVYSRVEDLGPGQDAPTKAKIVALISLLCWFGVICFGRLLPYFGSF